MVTQFNEDLKKGRAAEIIVYNYLKNKLPVVEDLTSLPDFYYIGDLRVITSEGEKLYIEVKNDSRIADTHNILCEIAVEYECHTGAGNMDCGCDIYAIVSEKENKIYFLDFKKLVKLTKYKTLRSIQHSAQTTICKFVSLSEAKYTGALIATVNYGG
jgi:hypothetical protein